MLDLLNSLQTSDLHARGLDDPIKALMCWSNARYSFFDVVSTLHFLIKIILLCLSGLFGHHLPPNCGKRVHI